jgi:hypothetical protein
MGVAEKGGVAAAGHKERCEMRRQIFGVEDRQSGVLAEDRNPGAAERAFHHCGFAFEGERHAGQWFSRIHAAAFPCDILNVAEGSALTDTACQL